MYNSLNYIMSSVIINVSTYTNLNEWMLKVCMLWWVEPR